MAASSNLDMDNTDYHLFNFRSRAPPPAHASPSSPSLPSPYRAAPCAEHPSPSTHHHHPCVDFRLAAHPPTTAPPTALPSIIFLHHLPHVPGSASHFAHLHLPAHNPAKHNRALITTLLAACPFPSTEPKHFTQTEAISAKHLQSANPD
ncbi:hypothetical protein MRB53_016876 [Persea americana]|uniref:Uncharacterized protein n=1 Tax=Persea americana TaxID=3435 RepID=A0ACC2M348_PERAE|nr:hypothetical protein MRB53_016876 [Persea americana]